MPINVCDIKLYGSECLRTSCTDVKDIGQATLTIISSMIDTMLYYNGVGLANNQIGGNLNIAVFDSEPLQVNSNYEDYLVLLNPKITPHKQIGTILNTEGCLSFLDARLDIRRFVEIEVEYLDIKTKTIKTQIFNKQLISSAIQHEVDHLNGITFNMKATQDSLKKNKHLLEDVRMIGTLTKDMVKYIMSER